MRISFANISTGARTRLSFLLKFVFSAFVIAFILLRIDFKAVLESLSNANAALLLLAFAISLVNFGVQYFKWKLIAEKLTGEKDKRKLLASLLLGVSAAMITPLQTGVYVGRASVFEKEKIPRAVFATFFDKITMLFLTAFLGSLVSLYFLNREYNVSNFVTVPLLALILLLGAFFFVVLSSDKIDNAQLLRAFLPKKLAEKFSDKIEFVNSLDAGLFWKTLPLFVVQKILLLAQFATLVYAFGGSGDFIILMYAALLVFFSKSFFPPVTVGDLGVREAMAIFFFGLAGIAEQTAFNAAMFLFVLNLLLPSLFSLWFLRRRKN